MGLMQTWLLFIYILKYPLLDFKEQKRSHTCFSSITYVLNTTDLEHTVQAMEKRRNVSPAYETYLNF